MTLDVMLPDASAHTATAPTTHLHADVGVVGAGPAGLFATYYAGLRDLSVAIVDSLDEPGGQVASLYPDKSIYDVAGHPDISGRALVDALLKQIEPVAAEMLNGHTVTGLQRLERDGDHSTAPRWRLLTNRDAAIDCRVVVLSAGAGSASPRRLPCAEDHLNRGAHHTTVAAECAAGRDAIVVGGGDSAIDCAMGLSQAARSVTIVHRSDRFRAHERAVAELRCAAVDLLTSAEVVACHGDPQLEAVTVRGVRDREEYVRRTSLLVVSLGMITRPGPLHEWGLDMDGAKVVVGPDMQTSLPGVFAIGDVATYPGKVPLIVTGFGDAATAVNNAAALLHPGADATPGHSTDRPPPRSTRERDPIILDQLPTNRGPS